MPIRVSDTHEFCNISNLQAKCHSKTSSKNDNYTEGSDQLTAPNTGSHKTLESPISHIYYSKSGARRETSQGMSERRHGIPLHVCSELFMLLERVPQFSNESFPVRTEITRKDTSINWHVWVPVHRPSYTRQNYIFGHHGCQGATL